MYLVVLSQQERSLGFQPVLLRTRWTQEDPEFEVILRNAGVSANLGFMGSCLKIKLKKTTFLG